MSWLMTYAIASIIVFVSSLIALQVVAENTSYERRILITIINLLMTTLSISDYNFELSIR
jgi:hypothetical protein